MDEWSLGSVAQLPSWGNIGRSVDNIVAGADGCRSGWVVVEQSLDTGGVRWETVPRLRALFERQEGPLVLAVDIPIGLVEQGARQCDFEARRLLGRPRGGSVFPAPLRAVLSADSYEEACAARAKTEGKRLSIQTWGIVPKVREVDTLVREKPELRWVIRESHPEISFYYMAGGKAMLHGKKHRAGREERTTLLRSQFGSVIDDALSDRSRLACAADDLLDAFAVLWSARRIFRAESFTIPDRPPQDGVGLPMQIVV